MRDISIRLYQRAADYALSKGIIIADTKFEFGLDADGTLTLMDEVLTPDSSRYWPVESYVEGINPPSYDKQFLRDWLEAAVCGRQALGQDGAGAGPACRADRQDRRQVWRSAATADPLMSSAGKARGARTVGAAAAAAAGPAAAAPKIKSRLLSRLDAEIAAASSHTQGACARAQRALLLARHGHMDAAREALTALHQLAFQHPPSRARRLGCISPKG